MKCIRIALDWTPNSLHVGLLLARYSGAYRKAGLDVILESPEDDQYLNTPMKKLVTGQIHVAIAPTDSVISYRTLHKEYPVVAIAAIQQHHNSAIATLADSGIDKPADLDGKVYGSYGARFEDAIVRQMVRHNGGNGMLRIVRPPKLSMWDALLEGEIDSESMISLQTGPRYNPFGGLYVSVNGGLMTYDFVSKSSLPNMTQQWLAGIGLTLAYDTPIGPVSFTMMSSSKTEGLRTYFNLGFPFK